MILNAILRGIKAIVDAVAKAIAWLLIALGLWIPLVYTLIFVVVVAFTPYTMAALSTIYFFGLFVAFAGAMFFSMMRSTKKAKERKHKSQTGYNISEVQRKDEDPIETIETPPTIQNEYNYYEPPEEEDQVPPAKQTWEEQVQQYREEQAKAQYTYNEPQNTEPQPVQRSMWDERQEPIKQTWDEPRNSQPELWHTIKPATREEKPKTDRWGAPISESDAENTPNDITSDNPWNSELYDTSWSPRSRDRSRGNWDEPKNNWDEPDWLQPKHDRTTWDEPKSNYSPNSTEWSPNSNWNEQKNDPMWDSPRQNDNRRRDRSRDNWSTWDDYRSEPRQNDRQNYRPDYNRPQTNELQNYDNYNNYNNGYNRPIDYGRDNNRADYNSPMPDYGAPMDNRPIDDFAGPVSDEAPKIFRLREDPNVLVYEYSDRLDYYKRSPQGNEFLRRKFK